ncbi:hypothetical protein EAI_03643 [Harpegnathos saltator]|uniref:Uncharacterized protein n=1 Tax=Harpegnathos saltator TaxID=610380 RepID=E2B2A1_HARSA|nr:hypothetical protein EAI_03643 [Harpegnathos saltator]
MRAWGYERKLEERKGGELAKRYWEEMREGVKKGKARKGWEEKMKAYIKAKGWRIEEVEELRERGEIRGEQIVEGERKQHREERWNKIQESRYNGWYSG